jgi:hypothetical protein
LQAAQDAALREAKEKHNEIEGSDPPMLTSLAAEEDLYHRRDCCMQRVLSLEEDFASEKPLLQLIIERAGHKCLFLPKFHCELNPIEMVWGQAKRRELQWFPYLYFNSHLTDQCFSLGRLL